MANVIFSSSLMVAISQCFSAYGPQSSEDLLKDEIPKPYGRLTGCQAADGVQESAVLTNSQVVLEHFSVWEPLLGFFGSKASFLALWELFISTKQMMVLICEETLFQRLHVHTWFEDPYFWFPKTLLVIPMPWGDLPGSQSISDDRYTK